MACLTFPRDNAELLLEQFAWWLLFTSVVRLPFGHFVRKCQDFKSPKANDHPRMLFILK